MADQTECGQDLCPGKAPTRVLFLDVDGVLNNQTTKETIATPLGTCIGLDQKLVDRYLTWITKHPEVDVVLSSSWRNDIRFRAFLNHAGIKWKDQTDNRANGKRGWEIDNYLYFYPYDYVAILDDMADLHPVGKYLVQTSDVRGLEDKHLRKVEKLLGLTETQSKEQENDESLRDQTG